MICLLVVNIASKENTKTIKNIIFIVYILICFLLSIYTKPETCFNIILNDRPVFRPLVRTNYIIGLYMYIIST